MHSDRIPSTINNNHTKKIVNEKSDLPGQKKFKEIIANLHH